MTACTVQGKYPALSCYVHHAACKAKVKSFVDRQNTPSTTRVWTRSTRQLSLKKTRTCRNFLLSPQHDPERDAGMDGCRQRQRWHNFSPPSCHRSDQLFLPLSSPLPLLLLPLSSRAAVGGGGGGEVSVLGQMKSHLPELGGARVLTQSYARLLRWGRTRTDLEEGVPSALVHS